MIVPEFQPLASDVDVWATASLFVHVTVVPTAIARSSGANARLPRVDAPEGIVTEDEEPPTAGLGGVDGDGAAGDDDDELPHAIVKARTDPTRVKRIDNIRTSTVTTRCTGHRFITSTISESRKATTIRETHR